MSNEKLLIVAQFEVNVESRGRDDVFSALEKCKENILKSCVVENITLKIEEM
jgi:phosphoribosylformylglycinamidine (FGAM) synthase PurS component